MGRPDEEDLIATLDTGTSSIRCMVNRIRGVAAFTKLLWFCCLDRSSIRVVKCWPSIRSKFSGSIRHQGTSSVFFSKKEMASKSGIACDTRETTKNEDALFSSFLVYGLLQVYSSLAEVAWLTWYESSSPSTHDVPVPWLEFMWLWPIYRAWFRRVKRWVSRSFGDISVIWLITVFVLC